MLACIPAGLVNNCTYGSPYKHTNIKITRNIITQTGYQCTRAIRSTDFNEDLNLWTELKLTRSPGRLFDSVTTFCEILKLEV